MTSINRRLNMTLNAENQNYLLKPWNNICTLT